MASGRGGNSVNERVLVQVSPFRLTQAQRPWSRVCGVWGNEKRGRSLGCSRPEAAGLKACPWDCIQDQSLSGTPETPVVTVTPMRSSRTRRPQHVSQAHGRQEGDDVQEQPAQENLLKCEWEAGFRGTLRVKEETSIRKRVPLGIRRRGCALLMRHMKSRLGLPGFSCSPHDWRHLHCSPTHTFQSNSANTR